MATLAMLTAFKVADCRIQYNDDFLPRACLDLIGLGMACNHGRGSWLMGEYAKAGDFFGVKVMIRRGASGWNTGIAGAAAGGSIEMVKLFESKGAELKYAITAAARYGKMKVVKYCISKDCDLKSRTDAMCEAAKSGYLDIVEYLEQVRGDYAGWYDLGLTHAGMGGRLDVVQYFISKGATAWDWAMEGATSENHLEVVKYLEAQGGGKGINWNRSMCWACIKGHLEMVKYLESKGAVNYGQGLKCAATGGHREVIEYLWPKCDDESRKAAIHEAEVIGWKDLADLLRTRSVMI